MNRETWIRKLLLNICSYPSKVSSTGLGSIVLGIMADCHAYWYTQTKTGQIKYIVMVISTLQIILDCADKKTFKAHFGSFIFSLYWAVA